jgi:hypothetical protein
MAKIAFLENKYTIYYYSIINLAKHKEPVGYCERHHIIPKSLGGSDTTDNIVALTAREHFVCHLLLTKMTEGNNKRLMHHAVGRFIQNSPLQNRRFTSWEYSKIRENISIARTGKKHSGDARKKMSEKAKGRIPHNKGKTGYTHSAESNLKRSNKLKGKTFEERFGFERAKEIKQKITNSLLGKPGGMLGKKHSEETKNKIKESNALKMHETRIKMSESRKGIKFSEEHLKNLRATNIRNAEKRKGIPLQKVECSYCNKIGGFNLMKRYHFENCKLKTKD